MCVFEIVSVSVRVHAHTHMRMHMMKGRGNSPSNNYRDKAATAKTQTWVEMEKLMQRKLWDSKELELSGKGHRK